LAAAVRVMLETCVLEVLVCTRGAKGDEKRQSSKYIPKTKVAPSAKKHIVLGIGALAALSSDGIAESLPHDRVPEVQSKADPRGPSTEPQT
jgi:hypothetical protein